jgi:hypothetical protein
VSQPFHSSLQHVTTELGKSGLDIADKKATPKDKINETSQSSFYVWRNFVNNTAQMTIIPRSTKSMEATMIWGAYRPTNIRWRRMLTRILVRKPSGKCLFRRSERRESKMML